MSLFIPGTVEGDQSTAVTETPPQQALFIPGTQVTQPGAEPKEQGFVEQAALGVKESLTPFSLTKEEAKQEYTLTRGIANVATDIAQVIGAAKLGAVVGTAVTPGVGTAVGAVAGLGLGVYRALGYESVRAEAEDRQLDPKKVAINMATELLPIFRHSKKVLNLALSAGQVAVQTEQAKQYGASGEQAILIGLLGGALAGATRKKVTPQEQQALGVAAFASDPMMTKQAAEGLEQFVSEADNSLKITQRVTDHVDKYHKAENALQRLAVADFPGEKLSRWRHKVDDADIEQVLKLPEAKPLLKQLRRKSSGLHKMFKQLATKDVVSSPEEFAAYLIAKDARDGLVQMITGTGGKGAIRDARKLLAGQATTVDEAYTTWRTKHHTLRETRDVMSEELAAKDPMKNPFLRWVQTDYHSMRAMDFVLGTDFRSKLDRIATMDLAHTASVSKFDTTIGKLEKEATKLKIDNEDIGRLLEMPSVKRKTELARLYPGRQATVASHLAKWRRTVQDIRYFGTQHNVEIPFESQYVTRVQQDTVKSLVNMNDVNKRVQSLAKKWKFTPDTELRELFDAMGRQESGLSRALVGQLWQSTMKLAGKKVKTVGDLDKTIRQLESPEFLKNKSGYEAMAAFSRTGKMPELIRERDIGRVMRYYARNMSRAVHLDQPIKDMQNMTAVLRTVGWDKSAKYVENYIRHQSGDPGAVTSWINHNVTKTKIQLHKALLEEEGVSGFTKQSAKAKLLAIDSYSFFMSQVYPNFLGASMRPVLRNLLQPELMTAREISGRLSGENLARKAYFKAASDRMKGVNLEQAVLDYTKNAKVHPVAARQWRDVVFTSGSPKAFDEGMHLNAIQDGLRKGGFVTKSAKFLETAGRASMWAYGKSDTVNRYVTIQMGKQLTKDMVKGVGYTREFLRNADPALLSDVKRLMKAYTREGSEDVLSTLELTLNGYLMGKTQFYYTRASSFQLGRELGPLFSVFAKWSTSIGSDVVEGFRLGKGYSNLTRKYLAPLAAVAGIYHVVGDTKDTPRGRALLMRDAWRLSPLAAPVGVSAPPVLSIGASLGEGILKAAAGDLSHLAKVGTETIPSAFMPFGWVPRALTDAKRLATGKD
jgi:hypothetical protein